MQHILRDNLTVIAFFSIAPGSSCRCASVHCVARVRRTEIRTMDKKGIFANNDYSTRLIVALCSSVGYWSKQATTMLHFLQVQTPMSVDALLPMHGNAGCRKVFIFCCYQNQKGRVLPIYKTKFDRIYRFCAINCALIGNLQIERMANSLGFAQMLIYLLSAWSKRMLGKGFSELDLFIFAECQAGDEGVV